MTWQAIFKLIGGLVDGDEQSWNAWDLLGSQKRKKILMAFDVYCAVMARRCESSDQECALCLQVRQMAEQGEVRRAQQ